MSVTTILSLLFVLLVTSGGLLVATVRALTAAPKSTARLFVNGMLLAHTTVHRDRRLALRFTVGGGFDTSLVVSRCPFVPYARIALNSDRSCYIRVAANEKERAAPATFAETVRGIGLVQVIVTEQQIDIRVFTLRQVVRVKVRGRTRSGD